MSKHFRFIEKEYVARQIVNNSDHLLLQQIQEILDSGNFYWNDLTFKFYDNGSVTIWCNNNNQKLSPRELTGYCLDFYVRKRIEMIKSKLSPSGKELVTA